MRFLHKKFSLLDKTAWAKSFRSNSKYLLAELLPSLPRAIKPVYWCHGYHSNWTTNEVSWIPLLVYFTHIGSKEIFALLCCFCCNYLLTIQCKYELNKWLKKQNINITQYIFWRGTSPDKPPLKFNLPDLYFLEILVLLWQKIKFSRLFVKCLLYLFSMVLWNIYNQKYIKYLF